ncbi:MAG: hypothetical protein WCD81_06345 [Candidatus Bathyarchaeia archaeon]
MVFVVNMVLQYKGVGRWKTTCTAKETILSFIAQTLLAWLVIDGVFMPH